MIVFAVTKSWLIGNLYWVLILVLMTSLFKATARFILLSCW